LLAISRTTQNISVLWPLNFVFVFSTHIRCPQKHPLEQNKVVRLEAMWLPPPLRINALSVNGKLVLVERPMRLRCGIDSHSKSSLFHKSGM
jgi:hypothetical protein